METDNFLDELLKNSEELELQKSLEYADLLLIEIKNLTQKITANWDTAEREVKIINDFYLSKNCKLQERIQHLEFKLNEFILSQEQRTLDLPNGTIRLRKGRDKIVVENLQEFLQNKYSHELVNIKEELKPDLSKIQAFITRSGGIIPNGCKVIPANENNFTYKLKGVDDGSET